MRAATSTFLLALGLLAACASRAPAPAGEPAAEPPAAMRRCAAPTDCVVVPRTCCGRCGAAVPGDAIAIQEAWLAEHQGYPCEGGEGCPDCFAETEPTLFATCRRSLCAVVDLRATPITACRADADCVVTHAACCSCPASPAIALHRAREPAYRRLRCGSGPVPCLACAAPAPAGVAACIDGRCVVR